MAGIKSLARKVQSKGRGRDRILAHINEDEARLLKARGGSGTRNPETGLLEFDDGEGNGGPGGSPGDGPGGDDGGGNGGGGDNGGGDSGGGGDTYYYPPVAELNDISALPPDTSFRDTQVLLNSLPPVAAPAAPTAAPRPAPVVTTPAAVLGQTGGASAGAAPAQPAGYRPNYYAYNRATPTQFGANYQAPAQTSGVQGAVNAAYSQNVGRLPDAGESQYWANYQRITGAAPGQLQQQMGQATAGEAETRQLQGTVSSQYEKIFGRSPDQEGLNYWTGQLRSGAADGNTMGGAMTNAAGQGDQVRAAYMQALGRAPDAQGLAYWRDQVQSGAVPASGLRAFLTGSVQPGTRDAAYLEDPGSVRDNQATVPAYFAPRAPQPMRKAMAAGGLAALPPGDRYARRLKR